MSIAGGYSSFVCLFLLPFFPAVFRVSVVQPHYSAEYGSNVTIGCRFPTDNSLNLTHLNIFWQQKLSEESKEVYKLQNGREDLSGQHQHFQGRATLLHEELKRGYSMLHITHVRITDAGCYLCVVNYHEADYKYIDLKIEAPYKRINIQERKEEEDHILTCQSEGYPLAKVFWLYEKKINNSIFTNTTYTLTDAGLFNIISVLRIRPSIPGNYSCVFQNKESRQTSAHRIVFPTDQRNASVTGKNSLSLFIPTILYVAMILFSTIKV
ncbi:programmed cell death 1 ligand 1 isoform 1-T1 [Liasis olivaceus]